VRFLPKRTQVRARAYTDRESRVLLPFFTAAMWFMAEDDFLDPAAPARLCDTGQGLNRVQSSPRVARAMRKVLDTCFKAVGGHWVGSSVVRGAAKRFSLVVQGQEVTP
jgi:hypothetical protein